MGGKASARAHSCRLVQQELCTMRHDSARKLAVFAFEVHIPVSRQVQHAPSWTQRRCLSSKLAGNCRRVKLMLARSIAVQQVRASEDKTSSITFRVRLLGFCQFAKPVCLNCLAALHQESWISKKSSAASSVTVVNVRHSQFTASVRQCTTAQRIPTQFTEAASVEAIWPKLASTKHMTDDLPCAKNPGLRSLEPRLRNWPVAWHANALSPVNNIDSYYEEKRPQHLNLCHAEITFRAAKTSRASNFSFERLYHALLLSTPALNEWANVQEFQILARQARLILLETGALQTDDL